MNPHPLTAFRKQANLTQQGLASLIGVARTTVARWETDARKIDRDLLPKISEKTGIAARDLRPDLAELFGEAAE